VLLGLNGASIMHTNSVTEIRIAREAGFDALEMRATKLERYLDAGLLPEDLRPGFGPLRPTVLSALEGIEVQDPIAQAKIRRDCERYCAAARALGCPCLQVIVLDSLAHLPWDEQRPLIARALQRVADLAAGVGLTLTLEPLAVDCTVRTLAQALEVLDAAGRSNVGLTLDTFHLWAAGTTPDEVARLDRRLIDTIHIGEATAKTGPAWTDDDRGALPGDGVLPMADWVAAIKATGYDGVWAVELWSPRHWEWPPELVARECKERLEGLLRV
jgi:sugar phosphate isomerase/epimerase